ncbi:hypothetical protein PAHAL_7G202100 [Panicum hallii]|uniref:B box-type domain-containing protein n=1 Tax=Panicum hallii TaxID=206008 RepID=A0A2S3I7Y7_9POAL|nr:B-box zinc finger protein 24-like isoform X1 [Panicum hallii]PAN38847.1 hypothetical protein PAHAL_7G202100 [Panicum hallii]
MRIQCDACEGAAATVVCCADEAALCARCDVEIHAANKLASKHQRLPLGGTPGDVPRCDVCQEKPAFIFCVEDRALFCRDCDEPIHVPGTLSGNHQRYLATGIRVGFSSVCGAGAGADVPPPPRGCSKPAAAAKAPASKPAQPQEVPSSPFLPPSGWAVEDLLQLSNYESSDKKDSPLEFKELEWFADIDLFHGHAPAKATTAEVPELLASPQPASSAGFYKTSGARQSKKPRVELPDDEDFFIVPDLG